jgi:neutral amino acid transport system substrate-binding protein
MKKRILPYLFPFVLLGLCLNFLACTRDQNPIKSTESISLGVILPLDQEKGVLREKALRTAVNIINQAGGVGDQRMIDLVVKSSEGLDREATAAKAAKDMIASGKNIVGFITSFSSCSKGVVEQIAIPDHYPVISGAATSGLLSNISPYFIRLCPTDAYEAIILSDQAKAYGIERIAMAVEEGEVYSSDLAATFSQTFGSGIGPMITFIENDPAFQAKIEELLAGEPEAIFISMLNPSVYKGFISQLASMNVNNRLANTTFILCDAFYNSAVFDSPLTMMIGEINGHPKNFGAIPAADTETSPYQYFSFELWEQYQQEVASYNAQFFDIGFLYAIAIEKTLLEQGTDDKAAFRERLNYWIRQVSHGDDIDPILMPSLGWVSIKSACRFGGLNYQGASGNCDIDNQGNTVTPYTIFTFTGEQGSYALETIKMVFPE